MDELTKYNLARWKALVEADALFTRPALNLDLISARDKLDPEGRLGDVACKDVLCLACGSGQQSIAFALLNWPRSLTTVVRWRQNDSTCQVQPWGLG